jgi:hypothetical protein
MQGSLTENKPISIYFDIGLFFWGRGASSVGIILTQYSIRQDKKQPL